MPFPAFILTAALTANMPAAATSAHVRNWEAAAKATKSIYADVVRTRTDRVLKKSNESSGNVLTEKPDRGRLRLEANRPVGAAANPNCYVALIWTGKETYLYDGSVKIVTDFGPVVVREKPKTLAEWFANLIARLVTMPTPLQLLDGSLPAGGLSDRFVTRLLKTDENYVYLELTPKKVADRLEFDRLIVVLHGPRVRAMPYTVRTVVIRSPSGQEEMWDFTNVTPNVQIPAGSFAYVPPPPGWKLSRPFRPNP